MRLSFILFFSLILLDGLSAFPQLDLEVSGWFYRAGAGFVLAGHPLLIFLHELAVKGSWALSFFLLAAAVGTAIWKKPLWSIDTKSWLFMFWGLVLVPGLIANSGFKDHWGRARPREVTEFGGTASFSPALEPQEQPRKNGSFVSGDGAFGFYLPAFAYLAPLPGKRRLSRQMFWGGMALGCLFGFARIAMGAHFLSDNLFAAFFMLLGMAGLHALFYGYRSTLAYWRAWLFQRDPCNPDKA